MQVQKKALITEEEIQAAVHILSEQIMKDYQGQTLLLVCLLKGSVLFFADLVRALQYMDIQLDFMMVSSYHGATTQSEEIEIKLDLRSSVEGKNILLVEDIIDSGNTLKKVISLLRERNPQSLAVAALTHKGITAELPARVYTCFEVSRFIVGYGMDYEERYRQLPYITELLEDDITG